MVGSRDTLGSSRSPHDSVISHPEGARGIVEREWSHVPALQTTQSGFTCPRILCASLLPFTSSTLLTSTFNFPGCPCASFSIVPFWEEWIQDDVLQLLRIMHRRHGGLYNEDIYVLRSGIVGNGGLYSSELQAASFRGHEQVVWLLLDKDADANAQGG